MIALPYGWQGWGAPEPDPDRPTIFISGGISGVPDYASAFQKARYALKSAGYNVVDPSLTKGEPGWRWLDWMRVSVIQLMACDGVALLPGYQYSKGANIEYALAESLGLPVKMVDEWVYPNYYDKG